MHFVKVRFLEFAKREISGVKMSKSTDTTRVVACSIQSPSFWIINFGVIVVCFLSGPFGTLEALPSGIRLIYWGLIVITTNILAFWLHTLIPITERTTVPTIFAISIIFGLLAAGMVLLLSLSLLQPIDRFPGRIELISYSFPIAALIFLLSALVMRRVIEQNDTHEVKRPALLQRLEKFPHSERILSLSARDHYVEVTTDIGTELCLLRFNDAIPEAEPEEGFQIHRSHWVAKSAVEKLENKGGTSQVKLTDGRIFNVSQARLTDFKGFLKGT